MAHFLMSEAVRPCEGLEFEPESGFYYISEYNYYVMVVSVSAETLFSLLYDLYDLLGCTVDVVLSRRDLKKDFHREMIDISVLKKIMLDFRDAVCNDGFLHISAANRNQYREVCLDDNKLLRIWTKSESDSLDFAEVLFSYGIMRKNKMRTILDVDHNHYSSEDYDSQFRAFINRIDAE